MGTSTVTVEDEKGAFKAVEHLIEQGCQKIVHLAGPEKLDISIRRLEGYTRALKAHDKEVDPNLIVDCNPGMRWDKLLLKCFLTKSIIRINRIDMWCWKPTWWPEHHR